MTDKNVVYEAQPARYVVELGVPDFSWDEEDTSVTVWQGVRSFENLGWAKDYADRKAAKCPNVSYRVVDTGEYDAKVIPFELIHDAINGESEDG